MSYAEEDTCHVCVCERECARYASSLPVCVCVCVCVCECMCVCVCNRHCRGDSSVGYIAMLRYTVITSYFTIVLHIQ